MQTPGDSFLRHIEGLIKEGKKEEARPLLAAYVQRHPESARAWWLLSLLLTDEKQQADCLERVLQLDPDSALARTRLAKIKGAADLLPEPEPHYSPYTYDPSIEIPSPNIYEPASFDESPPEVATQPAPAPEISKPVSVARASAPRNTMPRPGKKSSALPIVIALAVFCLLMVAIGFVAVMIFNQNQAPVQALTLLPFLPGMMEQKGLKNCINILPCREAVTEDA